MTHSHELESRLRDAIMPMPAIDVHSHVPAEAPFATSLADLLGYHYFTELAHSAGMDKTVIDAETPEPEMLAGLVAALERIDNTVQYGWMIELARELFGFQGERLTADNWEGLARAVVDRGKREGRAAEVMKASALDKVFLTNAFDEDLSAIDTDRFVPSLRADTLVFQYGDESVRKALGKTTGIDIGDAGTLKDALAGLVGRFHEAGALSLAISLPPCFKVFPVVETDLDAVVAKASLGKPLSAAEKSTLESGVLFLLSALCSDFGLPMQVMVGAVRNAYRHGVYQGMDLPQAGDTLRGLLPLLNAFPKVTFCLSVISSSQAEELASYAWIVRNVVVSGHWWYDTIPAYIGRHLTARLQSVPKTKLIGYYSDMYKLEFGLAKFNMYRRVLSRVLARDYVEGGRGTEEDALDVARLLLRGNAETIFGL